MHTLSTSLNEQGILKVLIDVPKETMNILNQQVIEDFTALLATIETDSGIKAVIISSAKENCFIAGADIQMLNQVNTALDGAAIALNAHTLLQSISHSPKPFIAAIDGVCLGGGYELALACHYRIASLDPATKIGLPEVMLGLLPGGMGTSKLPRLIGLPKALDLLLTGKQIPAKRALRTGMIDEVVASSLLSGAATAAAEKLLSKNWTPKPEALSQAITKWPVIRHLILRKARQQLLAKTRGAYPAPLAILAVIQQGLGKPLEQALAIEAQAFGTLTVSPQAKALMQLYFANNALKKARFVNSKCKPKTVKKLGILGGGLMGAGIAAVSIEKADCSVRLKDISHQAILNSYSLLDAFYQKRRQRQQLSAEQARKKINQLSGTLDYSGFEQADMVIEAVVEDLSIKQQMVDDIEALGNHSTVFASNTSSIPIADIAAKAARPHNIIGMHYFSPVEKMPLLEIVKHPQTAEETLATAIAFGRRQQKTVIVVNDGPGFYVNRILAPYINAALYCATDGAAFDSIDHALSNFGFPVGPFKLLDEVGLDVGSKIQPLLASAFGERMQGPAIQTQLLNKQRLGKKVKKGFYRYDKAGKSKKIDISVYQDLGFMPTQHIAEKTLIERCVYMMLNEATYCLQDEIIASPRDGDIGAIFGIGFPPFLGGPFRYMDSLGIAAVVDTLKDYQQQFGDRYQPAPLLVDMAAQESSFY
ncbi:MAG: fatty acid oxidation complex subunit alpha FadJ [Cellvibrionaceae bacterium]|nr:fatty acid oxidation complex subunit alpha FadJ [Cellvibrionaceae bacterium]